MFGLQFAVSAGRCTRGAFMQVIPVNRDDLPMSYIAVIDTEGLRAPELQQLKHNRDNELATLVIGLGDVTLINIMGENTTEIKDVLQIAVHAFMRMKLVSRHVNMHQTCLFIHQNVPAVNAKQKMLYGCEKLLENLDSMTKEAAEEENISDIDAFSQIIKFDVHKNVWYFPSLWHGNPPMAPANPDYSEHVHNVALHILEMIAKKQQTFPTTSDLSIRLGDLWNGILADDFVFSFRNTLELKMYNRLELKYNELVWELQSSVTSWIEKTKRQMTKCETVDELERCIQRIDNELSSVVSSCEQNSQSKLKMFFKESNYQETIVQWQQRKFSSLQYDARQIYNQGRTNLLEDKEAQRIDLMRRRKWDGHKLYVINKAVELADRLKGREATDAALETKFASMWKSIVNELALEEPAQNMQIGELRTFHAHAHTVRGLLVQRPLSDQKELPSMQGNTPVEQGWKSRFFGMVGLLRQRDHPIIPKPTPNTCAVLQGNKSDLKIDLIDVSVGDLSLKTSLFNRVGSKIGLAEDNILTARRNVVVLTNRVLQEIDVHLQSMCSQDIKIQQSHATEVIMKLKNNIDKCKNDSEKLQFTIRPEYVVKLAVHVSRHCFQVFTSKQHEYEQKHGAGTKLEAYKQTALNLFKNMVKQSTEEVIAADLLCDTLKDIIEDTVTKTIPRKVVDEVIRDFSRTKHYLMIKIMEDLALNYNFDDYEIYIGNATTFALMWITRYTNVKFFSIKPENHESRYGELTKIHLEVISECIKRSAEQATREVHQATRFKMQVWIKAFIEKIGDEIPVSRSSLEHMADRNVADFDNFKRLILEKVDAMKTMLVSSFSEHNADTIKSEGTTPYQQVMDRMWGCPEQCPFCKEPCAETTPDHFARSGQSHTCVQHRPEGIAGFLWYQDNTFEDVAHRKDELVTQTCNYCVQSRGLRFRCNKCHLCRRYNQGSYALTEWHDYREYKTYFPEWDIAPDSINAASKYWMWFMATYQYGLKDLHDARLPNIPRSWYAITQEEALTDLRKNHN